MDETVTKSRMPSKSRLVRWIGTLISSGLFLWLLARQDWGQTWQSLTQAPAWLLPVVFLLYFSGMLLNSLRWDVLLRAQAVRIPFLEVLKMVLTGAFASNFLPSTIGGDTVRVVGLTRFKTSWSLSVASVVVDRMLNVVAMVTILPFSLFTFGNPGTLLQNFSFLKTGGVVLTGLVPAGSWAARALAKLRHWAGRLWEIFQIWLRRPGSLALSFILAWSSSFIVFFAIWVLARGLGMSLSLYQVMGVMALTYLFSLLPISINGYGVREVAVTTLYMQLGASLEGASTLAVITRFMLLLEALPGAFWLSQMVAPQDKGEGAV